jgi:hypothetical protein
MADMACWSPRRRLVRIKASRGDGTTIDGLDRLLDRIGPGPRAALLRMLEAPEEERAALIGRLYRRDDGELLGELLFELEDKEWARQFVIEELHRRGA